MRKKETQSDSPPSDPSLTNFVKHPSGNTLSRLQHPSKQKKKRTQGVGLVPIPRLGRNAYESWILLQYLSFYTTHYGFPCGVCEDELTVIVFWEYHRSGLARVGDGLRFPLQLECGLW